MKILALLFFLLPVAAFSGASIGTPTGLPPGGTAGGELSGSYPNPTVSRSFTPNMTGLWTFSAGAQYPVTSGSSNAWMYLAANNSQPQSQFFHNYASPTVDVRGAGPNPGGNLFIGGAGNFTMDHTCDSLIGIGGFDVENGAPYKSTLSSVATSARELTAVGNGNLGQLTTGTDVTAIGAAVFSALTQGNNSVGIGANIAGNTAPAFTDAESDVFIGTSIGGALSATATDDTFIGNFVAQNLGSSGNQDENTVMGSNTMAFSAGSKNTIFGASAGGSSTSSVSGSILIGWSAGKYATTSNEGFVSNFDSGSYANDKAKSILYFVMSSTTANQSLTVNGVFKPTQGVTASGSSANDFSGSSGAFKASSGATTLPNLTTNGFVKTSGGTGLLSVDTNTYALASSVPAAANPTGTVGPTATNGSASTFMRSDAAPAVNLTAAYTWTGLHIFNSTSGLGVGGAPSSAPNSFGTLVYMTRTTAPASATVGLLQYDYYALTPVDNTTVQTAFLGDMQLNGSGTSGTGHSIGGIFRATDTASNAGGQFSGLEGKRVSLSNTNNGAAIFAVGDYNSSSSMSSVVNQGLNFLMEHFNGSTSTPVAAGEMDLITAQPPVGGDTTKMYGIKLLANWQIRTGGAIASWDSSTGNTRNINMSDNGTDGLIQTNAGNIYLNPAGGLTAPVGSFVPFTNNSNLGQAGNSWVATITRLIGGSSAPTIAAGTGAGTSPTVTVTGTDLAGYISVTTGTAPTLSATVATVTFNTTYAVAPRSVEIDPANSNAALLSGVTEPFVNQAGITTTTFAITAGTTALSSATAYQWYYHVVQ